MKSKVSLKEMVGVKIIYALLLVCYYWMWARQDWHHYYDTIPWDYIERNLTKVYGNNDYVLYVK